jgi:acyl-CoA reductase-like NAD-dependent aldehyde dehydrogenase
MSQAREEIFGPFAALMSVPRTRTRRVRIANMTPRYGLAAAVATRSVSTAHRLARNCARRVYVGTTYSELACGLPVSAVPSNRHRAGARR